MLPRVHHTTVASLASGSIVLGTMDDFNVCDLADDLLRGNAGCQNQADVYLAPATTAGTETDAATSQQRDPDASNNSSDSQEHPAAADAPGPHRRLRTAPSFSPPSQHRRTTSWWAPVLKEHTRHIPCDDESLHSRTVISACTGCFAEAEVLKARLGCAVFSSSSVRALASKLLQGSMGSNPWRSIRSHVDVECSRRLQLIAILTYDFLPSFHVQAQAAALASGG